MSADTEFMETVAQADRRHAATCKCGTSARLVGRDGPSFAMLSAALQVAIALADEFDCPVDQIAAKSEATQGALAKFRSIR